MKPVDCGQQGALADFREKDEKEMKGFKMNIEEKDAENGYIPRKRPVDPQKEREEWIIQELQKPPGWSPYDYPESERANISFDAWKEEDTPKADGVSGQSETSSLVSLLARSKTMTHRAEQSQPLIEDLDECPSARQHTSEHPSGDLGVLQQQTASMCIEDSDSDLETEELTMGNNVKHSGPRRAWTASTEPAKTIAEGETNPVSQPKLELLGEEANTSLLFVEEAKGTGCGDGRWASQRPASKRPLIVDITETETGKEEQHISPSDEAEASEHLLRGLEAMESTGFSKKGVIEYDGCSQQPFIQMLEDEGSKNMDAKVENQDCMVDQLDKDSRPAMRGDEFLREGGSVHYNLATFGFE